nr:hypothetical protein [Nakamurella multipartita]
MIMSLARLPHHYRRVTPHLFTDTQITALLEATSTLQPALRARIWHTLIGLLAVSELRVGEACRLDDTGLGDDSGSDPADGVCGLPTIRKSKHGKHRQVPIHASTVAALRRPRHLNDQQHRRRPVRRPGSDQIAFPAARVDNPCSEAWFTTLKYAPVFPERFTSLQPRERSCPISSILHHHHHRHLGVGLHTPADVHYGHADDVQQRRLQALAAARQQHPTRFTTATPIQREIEMRNQAGNAA